MGNAIFAVIVVLLILLLLYGDKIRNSQLYKQAKEWVRKDFMQLPADDSISHVAWDVFIFSATVIFTTYISHATWMVNMTTWWILLIGAFVIAMVTSLRAKFKPKDNRLDNLGQDIKNLSDELILHLKIYLVKWIY